MFFSPEPFRASDLMCCSLMWSPAGAAAAEPRVRRHHGGATAARGRFRSCRRRGAGVEGSGGERGAATAICAQRVGARRTYSSTPPSDSNSGGQNKDAPRDRLLSLLFAVPGSVSASPPAPPPTEPAALASPSPSRRAPPPSTGKGARLCAGTGGRPRPRDLMPRRYARAEVRSRRRRPRRSSPATVRCDAPPRPAARRRPRAASAEGPRRGRLRRPEARGPPRQALRGARTRASRLLDAVPRERGGRVLRVETGERTPICVVRRRCRVPERSLHVCWSESRPRRRGEPRPRRRGAPAREEPDAFAYAPFVPAAS